MQAFVEAEECECVAEKYRRMGACLFPARHDQKGPEVRAASFLTAICDLPVETRNEGR